MKLIIAWVALLVLCQVGLARARAQTIAGKSWPVGYFYKYRKAAPKEKQRVFADVEKVLEKMNEAGEGLIVKGTIITKVNPKKKIFDKIAIWDESGLKIIAYKVPNIYYQFKGPRKLINNNTYLVLKNVKFNVMESIMSDGFVVEGNYHSFAQKYILAIMGEIKKAPKLRSNKKIFPAINQK